MTALLPEAGLILAKSSAILLIAWLISLLLRKTAPILENYLWICTFLAILLLPLLSLNLSWPGLEIKTPDILSFESKPLEPIAIPTETVMVPATPTIDFHNFLKIGGLIWVVGSAVLLLRFALANLLLAKTRRQSISLPDAVSAECCRTLGFRGQVKLKKHPHSPTPMGWGLFSATILVPDDFERWAEDRQRFVLLHELSHIARRDTWFRFTSELVRCLYWINPLVWIALRRLRLSEELATDAHVISTGGNQTSYAELLLFHARTNTPQVQLFDSVAAGMARKHTISQRIEWILSDRDKAFPKLRRWLPMLVVTAVGFAALSSVQFLEAEAEKKEVPVDKNLWTESYRINRSDFASLGNKENTTATDVLWGARDLAPGWAATYNPATGQLIVRTIKSEHARIREMLPPATSARFRIGVLAFEIPKPLAAQLRNQQDRAKVYQQLTAAMKSGDNIQFLSRLDLTLPAGTRKGSAISGNGETTVMALINPKGDTSAELDLGFKYTYADGKTEQSFSDKQIITQGETSLIGITNGRDGDHKIAVFARY
ncbi:MAG: M56 family metallopeptidase [Verrucomicrobiales bacterium]|nr:M56 family metallopeptidase [Verrucomicrobiales bacterium]